MGFVIIGAHGTQVVGVYDDEFEATKDGGFLFGTDFRVAALTDPEDAEVMELPLTISGSSGNPS